jgi:hypothetical protein
MNRKDAAVVVDADDRVHVAAGEQPFPQRRAAMIGGQAGRKNKSDATSRAGEVNRPLDEQLVTVGVAGLRRVFPRRG